MFAFLYFLPLFVVILTTVIRWGNPESFKGVLGLLSPLLNLVLCYLLLSWKIFRKIFLHERFVVGQTSHAKAYNRIKDKEIHVHLQVGRKVVIDQKVCVRATVPSIDKPCILVAVVNEDGESTSLPSAATITILGPC